MTNHQGQFLIQLGFGIEFLITVIIIVEFFLFASIHFHKKQYVIMNNPKDNFYFVFICLGNNTTLHTSSMSN